MDTHPPSPEPSEPSVRRVLLIETLHQHRFRHHRAEYYPYLLGLAHREGWQAEWWVLTVPAATMHSGARYAFDLPEAQRGGLAAEVAAWAPDVLVFHDRPAEALAAALREAAPGVQIVDMTAATGASIDLSTTVPQLLALFAGRRHARRAGEPYLLDEVHPSFARRFVGEAEDPASLPPLRLMVEPYCPFRRKVSRNPYYAGLDTALVREHEGCSFCPRYAVELPSFATPPIERAVRQVVAHQEATGGAGAGRRYEYVFEDTLFNKELAGFFEALLEHELAPSTFNTMLRADMLLAQRDALERVLPRIAKAGHALVLMSIGAENFSEPENARLNKGVTTERLWRCYDLLRDWERRFPGTFGSADVGYFAAILFTPWTRPEDLKENIAAARRLGPRFLGKAMGTRLQLWDELAITDLVREDGLLAEEHGAAGELAAVCITEPRIVELPWRFADPRTERICRLLIRLDPLPEQATFGDDDPLLAEVRAARAALPPRISGDFVALCDALVDAVVALGPEAPVDEVFAYAGEHAVPSDFGPTVEEMTTAAGAGDPEPSEAGPEVSPIRDEHAWTLYLVRQVEERAADRLGGYRLTGHALVPDAEPPSVRLDFEREGRPFSVEVADRQPGARAWLSSRDFVATHPGQLPADHAAAEKLTRFLLAMFDRYGPKGGVGSLVP